MDSISYFTKVAELCLVSLSKYTSNWLLDFRKNYLHAEPLKNKSLRPDDTLGFGSDIF